MTGFSETTVKDSPLCVACAVDDRFAMPLAVTVRSILDTLGEDRRVRLFVIDGGITDENKDRLSESWRDHRLSCEWLTRPTVFERCPTPGHFSPAIYLRLALPNLLPPDVGRAVYLDSDVVVRRDLATIWDEAPPGRHCWAVQDLATPFVDARVAMPDYVAASQHLVMPSPIPNHAELGIPPETKYFNSGVLALDVELWRRDDLFERFRECIAANPEHMQFPDQYALNVVLAGLWGELDHRWNQGSHVYSLPGWRESTLDEEAFARLRDDPYIVHFTSYVKPWHALCRHPFRGEFYAVLDRTAWAGWRPTRAQTVRELCRAPVSALGRFVGRVLGPATMRRLGYG